jgi:NitT/TauT family transport system substrate-binding protein
MRGVRWQVAALAAVAALMAGCGGGSSGSSSGSGSDSGSGPKTVTMGTIRGSSADAAVFVAIEKGFFRDEGVKLELQPFNSGAQFVAPLGAGQLDAGSGGISAGLFNAVANGVGVKMVAAKSIAGSPSYTSLLVRKSLVKSGAYKDFSDLEGLKVAIPALGTAPHTELSLFLKKGGLTMKDVKLEELGFADMVPALKNGSVDAAVAIEPSATLAVRAGGAVKVAGSDEVFPGEQSAAIMFGDRFIQDDPETAQKVMDGYLRGARYFRSAQKGTKLHGKRGREVAQIIAKYTKADPKLLMSIPLHTITEDAALDIPKIQREVDFWRSQGLIKSDVKAQDAIDTQFIDQAVKDLAGQ